MRKLLAINVLGICVLTACNAGSTAGGESNLTTCPTTAPMFSAELGTQLINNWGASVTKYSSESDVYVSAAYFTAANYLSDGVLLPTVSATTRVGSQAIYNYFTDFLALQPTMTNNPESPESGGPYETLAGCGYGVTSGYYNFVFGSDPTVTNARYTFQFMYIPSQQSVSITVESGPSVGQVLEITQPGGWYINLQNSAKLPS